MLRLVLIQIAAFVYAICSRLAYVLFVGIALRRETAHRTTRGHSAPSTDFALSPDRRARHEQRCGCLDPAMRAHRNTLSLAVSPTVSFISGAVLIIVGIGAKVWAACTLGGDAYYWRNFFAPRRLGWSGDERTVPLRLEPDVHDRLPAYLRLGPHYRSLPGMIAAAFAHAAILIFYVLVEKPHFERLHR
jgi:hypothetical protein